MQNIVYKPNLESAEEFSGLIESGEKEVVE